MHEEAIKALDREIAYQDEKIAKYNMLGFIDEATKRAETIRQLGRAKMVLFIDGKSREGAR